MQTATVVEEDRVTMTEPLRRFCEAFDFETYCLELWQDEDLTAAMREAAEKRFEKDQRAFDGMLARHPATLAENARRAEMRRLEKERLDGIAASKREREERRKNEAMRYLRRRWHAMDVSRSA